jgi:RimJ/RimL family protein N-acetyltransferase
MGDERLRLFEPTRAQVRANAARLSRYYNEPHNRAMLSHDEDLSPKDVVSYFGDLWRDGDRPFLLARNGVVVGDADLRNRRGGSAECTLMVGARSAQGRGLGTRFAVMLHKIAFDALGLQRVYCTVIPANRASQGLFQKLGYSVDNGRRARSLIDEDDDISMSVSRARFRELHAPDLLATIVSYSARSQRWVRPKTATPR